MKRSHYKIYANSQAAWDAMYHAIAHAARSIYWEMYIFVDDEAGRNFFDLLEEKAAAGVDVKLILDWFGSFSVSRARIDHLKQAGVDVRFFQERKYRYRGLWLRLISRTHRKILIVDEYIGFIGGVNIQKHMRQWWDIHVRVKGNAVHSLLRAFAKMYLICGGPKFNVRHLLKYHFRVDKERVGFIYDDADSKRSRMRKRYIEAIARARERVILFSPYYFPDKAFLQALWYAKQRGVRVDLLIPFRTDLRIVTYAAYTWFSLMTKLGVRIHLLKEMMHGKGVLVDDDWAIVGSSNIEHTSFYDNYEANVKLEHKKTVKRLQHILLGWIDKAQPLDLVAWENRGCWQRGKERMAYWLYRLWHKKA